MKRRRLNDVRLAITHKLQLPEHAVYFRIGLFEDGTPGEVFINLDQDGSGLGHAYHQIGVLLSMCLQSGWTVEMLHKKFSFVKGVPDGYTGNQFIRFANSIIDYLVRWMLSDEFKESVCKNKQICSENQS